jgi:hypothetical protein
VRVALLLWLLCHPAPGWSQHKPVHETTPDQQQPQAKGRNAQDSPLAGEVPHSEITEKRAAKVAKKHEQETATDWASTGLLLVGIFQAVMFVGQLWLMWRVERTTKRQLRAYVFGSVVVSDPNSARGVNFTLTVTNSGQTPAYDSTFVFSTRHVDYFPGLPLLDLRGAPMQGWQSKGPIPPGGMFVSVIKAPAFTADEMAALVDGIKAVFAFGEIRYTDAFSTGRSTKFRFLFGGDVGVAAGPLATTQHGNDAD